MSAENIAAASALLVALISLVGTILLNFQTARINRRLEEWKLQGEKNQMTQALKDEYFKETVSGIGALIQSIQKMKDQAQLILTASGDTMYSEAALKNIAITRSLFFDCFERQLVHLKKSDFRETHRTKGIMLSFETLLKHALDGKKFVSEMNESDRSELQLLRSDMSEIQNMLRDSRADLLAGRFKDL